MLRAEPVGSRALVRSTAIVYGAFLAAVAVAWLAAAIDPPAARIVVPGLAVLVVSGIFAVWRAEGIGAFLLFLLVATTVEVWIGVDLNYFDELGLIGLIVAAVVRRWIPGRRQRVGVAEVAIVVVAIAGIASSLLQGVPLGIWTAGMLLLLKGVVFFYLVSWLELTVEDVERVGIAVLGVALVILALGFIELLDRRAFQLALGLPVYDEVRGGLAVIKSIFLHPSLFGWFTVFASLILYARFVVTRAWWLLPPAVLLNVGTLLSGRRTPILGLALALLVALAWQWRHSWAPRLVLRTWVPMSVAAVVLLAAFLPVLGGIFGETLRDYEDTPEAITEILSPDPDPLIVKSVAQRTALYVASVAIARDHFPLGGGFGRFGSYISRAEYSPLYERYGLTRIYGLSEVSPMALNDTFWPSVLGETGVIGFTGFAVFIGAIFARLWKASARDPSPAWRAMALAAILIFVDRLVGSLTAPTYVAPPIAYFLFGTLGAVLAVATTRDEMYGAEP